jgi:hypothetical protein
VIRNENSKEFGKRAAADAVSALHEAVRNRSNNTEVSKRIGSGRQTVIKRWKRGDMRLSEFAATARAIGISPSRVLYRAVRKQDQKEKSPQVPAAGNETERK